MPANAKAPVLEHQGDTDKRCSNTSRHNRNTNTYQEEGASMLTRIAEQAENFETAHTVDARFAGGTILLDTQHEAWLGETFIQVEIPGLAQPLALRTYEARDLAAALQTLATHIDESGVAA